jgi:hypothetical protein
MTHIQWITVNFRGEPSVSALVSGLIQAASTLPQSELFVGAGKKEQALSFAALDALVKSFAAHEYAGEVKWRIETAVGSIRGALQWPIYNAGALLSSIEVNASFGSRLRKVFSFGSAEGIVNFALPLCKACDAVSMLVRPRDLPANEHDFRYRRFNSQPPGTVLSSVDWIFGLGSQVAMPVKPFNAWKTCAAEGFRVWILKPEPLDLTSPEDMKLLMQAESSVGLDSRRIAPVNPE